MSKSFQDQLKREAVLVCMRSSGGYISLALGHFAYSHVRRVAHLINELPLDLPRVSGRYQLLLIQHIREKYLHSPQVSDSLNETGANEQVGKHQSRTPQPIQKASLLLQEFTCM